MIIGETFNIAGRGKVVVVTFEKDDPKYKVGDYIELNGIMHLIRGIEMSVKPLGNPILSATVGLLVREVPKQEAWTDKGLT